MFFVCGEGGNGIVRNEGELEIVLIRVRVLRFENCGGREGGKER